MTIQVSSLDADGFLDSHGDAGYKKNYSGIWFVQFGDNGEFLWLTHLRTLDPSTFIRRSWCLDFHARPTRLRTQDDGTPSLSILLSITETVTEGFSAFWN